MRLCEMNLQTAWHGNTMLYAAPCLLNDDPLGLLSGLLLCSICRHW